MDMEKMGREALALLAFSVAPKVKDLPSFILGVDVALFIADQMIEAADAVAEDGVEEFIEENPHIAAAMASESPLKVAALGAKVMRGSMTDALNIFTALLREAIDETGGEGQAKPAKET